MLSKRKKEEFFPPFSNLGELSSFQLRRIIHETLAKRVGLDVLLHRIVLSARDGEKYDCYDDLCAVFGQLKYETEPPKYNDKSYRKYSYAYIAKNKVIIRWQRIAPIYPSYQIQIINPQPETLKLLALKCPGIRLSCIEVAIDFLLPDPESVRAFLWLLEKYLYFPRKRNDKIIIDSPSQNENNVLKLVISKLLYFKIYERGMDKNKNNGKWKYTDLDRLRMEITLKQYLLKMYNAYTLFDFITSPNIGKMLQNQFCFRTFKNISLKVPHENEFFTECDNNGFPIPFHFSACQINKTFDNSNRFYKFPAQFKDLNDLIYTKLSELESQFTAPIYNVPVFITLIHYI